MDSLETTDQQADAVAVAPRVTLEEIKSKIVREDYFTISDAVEIDGDTPEAYEITTVCVLLMDNGFTEIGKSAPAAPENFNRELGRKFAYEDAVRHLWPHMGYALREQLHKESTNG